MRIVNFSEARANLKALIDQAAADQDVVVITRRDAPDGVLMSKAHYDSLVETAHLLGTPANAAHLERSIAQARGEDPKC